MPRMGLDTDAVLDAACELADEEGLAATTLTRLANRLGIRSPSLYKHIDGLDGLQRGLTVRGLEEANRRLRQATIGKARHEALFALAHAYWRFARERPGLYTASLRMARPGENDVARAGEALLSTLLAVLAGYGVHGDDALHATRGLRAIIHGFVSLDAAGGFRLSLDLNESLDRLLWAFLHDLDERTAADGASTLPVHS